MDMCVRILKITIKLYSGAKKHNTNTNIVDEIIYWRKTRPSMGVTATVACIFNEGHIEIMTWTFFFKPQLAGKSNTDSRMFLFLIKHQYS